MKTQLSKMNWDVLHAYAKCNMNARETSRALSMHRNTIEYNLKIIRDVTGLNPCNFYDLVVLTEPYWIGGWVPMWEDGKKFFMCPECGNAGNPWWVACPVCGEELRPKDG